MKNISQIVKIWSIALIILVAMVPTASASQDVTLTLYIHDGSPSGSLLSNVQVTGYDSAGNSFSKTTSSGGYVTITGKPGTWSFTASKSGYNSNSWGQSITTTCVKHAYLTATVQDVTLTLYIHDGSPSGSLLSNVQVTGYDGAGNSFSKTTSSGGYVTITGKPGTWSFTASKSGYNSNSWSQSITATCVKHASLPPSPSETVSIPSMPSGTTSGEVGTTYTYTTGGSTSNLGHSVQYYFDWGDGTVSGWLPVGTTSATKSWSVAGDWGVKSRSRCAIHTSVESGWSSPRVVRILQPTSLSITDLTPSTITTSQSTYDATLSASGSNFNNVNQVTFSWSGPDSGSQTWNKGDTNWNTKVTVNSDTSMTLHSRVLSNAGGTQTQQWTWTVTLRDTSGATKSRTFTVKYEPSETVSIPIMPSGTTSGEVGTTYTYTTGGSTSNLGHSVQYYFDWGDGTVSGWLPVGTTSATKSWSVAGDWGVKSRSRCAIHTSVESGWSSPRVVRILQPTSLSFTDLTPPIITTSQSTSDAQLSLSGSNFNNVNQVTFSWSGPDSDSQTWNKGDANWNTRVTVNSDTSMTLRPMVLSNAGGTQTQQWTWTVTLRDASGATKSRTFTVTFTPEPIVSPSVSTSSTTNVGSNQATLNGQLTSMGGTSSCTVYFEYGPTSSLGSTTPSQSMSSMGSFSWTLTGGTPGTTYHYRAVASNSAGIVMGDIQEWTYQQQIVSPLITGVDPSQPEVNPSRQWLSILGSGFVSQSQVTLSIDGIEYPIPSDRTDFVSANKINVSAGLTVSGKWKVLVSNPDGQQSNEYEFDVKSSTQPGGRYRINWENAAANGWFNPLGENTQLWTHPNYDFDSQVYPTNFNMRHAGLDLVSESGQEVTGWEVHAIADGLVAKVSGKGTDNEYVIIQHNRRDGSPFFAIYGHINTSDKGLGVGSPVYGKQIIGIIRDTGYIPDHLHFGINTNNNLNSFQEDGNNWGQTKPGIDPRDLDWQDPLGFLDSYQPSTPSTSVKLNVPYIHQVYDTADDFIGCWACAPTSAVMVLAYHGLIEKDPIEISSISYGSKPPRHESDYGKYVSREYPYGNTVFSTESEEYIPNIGWAKGKGAWGYIWTGSATGVADRLESYLKRHDLEVEFIASPTAEQAKTIVIDEIDNNSPLIARTYLTGDGHYAVITGYEIDSNGGISYYVNDPFGKKGYYHKDYGTYTNEIAQPVKYSYSDMGLGEPSRGLFKVTSRVPTPAEPSVSTSQATSVGSSSATLNGQLTSMGGASSCTVYFEYGPTSSLGSTTPSQSMSSMGSFSWTLTDGTPGTKYCYRAVASNSAGIVMGDIQEWTYQQQIVSPLITGVDPSQPEVNPSRQWLSILGSGFVSQSQVTLCINGNEHSIPSDRTDFVSANKINVLVGLTDPGTWTVQIVNPDNKKSNNFDFVVTSSAPTGWGLDTELVDLINKHAPNYYNDSWNISLSQYKAWIALISLREAGYGRYVAHSQWGGGYEGDRFNHINVGDAFSFSTGIGAFQLDRGGSQGNANEEWDKMPTIDKLNPDIALLSILRHHKDRFGAGSTLEQFSINSPWVAVRPANESDFSNDWFQITGSSWDVSKKKREDVQFNPPTVVDTFESQVRKIGTIQWSLSPRWNGYFDTWKISARNWDGGLVCEYYYTYKDGWEIWVYNDPQQSVTHYFEREYQEGQYPQNRQNNEAQVDLAGSTSPQSIIVLATDHNPIKTFESDHKTYDFGEPVEISYSVSTDKGIEEIEILRSDDESIDLDEWDPVWGICLREDLKSYSGSIRDTPLYCNKYWYTIRIKDKEGHSFTTYETISIEVKNLLGDGKWLRILNENPEWVNSISINDNYCGYTNLININKYTQNFALSDGQINALSENTDPALVNNYYVSSLESQENLYAASTSYTVKAKKNGYLEYVQSISADFSGVKDITVSLLADPNHKDSIDIVAGKIYIKGNSASPGNRINIEADIFNDGELASGNFIVRGAILGGSEFGSIQINNLNPGERYTIDEWSTVWPADQDELLLWVWADSGKIVSESDELNNLLVEKFKPSDEIPVSPTPEPTITPQPIPIAYFTANTAAGPAPLIVQFTETSTGNPTSWSWDFGDGVTSTEQNPVHTYTTPGTYTAILTVTNAVGSDSARQNIMVTTTQVGSIAVSSAPAGAAIWLDGTDTRLTTNTTLTNIPAGDHVVRVDLDGYQTMANIVTVAAGETAEVTFALGSPAITLSPGWNFISVPKTLSAPNNTAGSLFGSVDTCDRSILGYSTQTLTWIPIREVNEIIQPLNGYWIYAAVGTDINLTYPSDPTPPSTKTLYPGWNAVGLSADEQTMAHNALACLNGSWKTVIPWNFSSGKYDPAIVNGGLGPNSPERLMTLGNGYWVYVDSESTLIGLTA